MISTISIFFLAASAFSVIAQDKKIRIMLYEWYPYVGPELTDNGLTADILTTAFENAGYEVKFNYFPWRRCLAYLDQGTWDVLINLYYTEKRAARYAYPKNHISVNFYTLFTLKSRTDIPDTVTLDDLKKFKIGLVKKASYGEKFDAVKNSLPNIYTDALSEKNLLSMLLADRVDIVPSDMQYGWFTLKNNIENWQSVRTIDSDFFEKKKLFPVFSKKNPHYVQLVSDWDKSIEKMIADGSLIELHNKHGAAYNR